MAVTDATQNNLTETISELFGQLRALQTEKHEFDTVVLDSLDWIEPLIWKAVCEEGEVETIEQYAGGYGKGYVRALDLWRKLIKELAGQKKDGHLLGARRVYWRVSE